MTTTDTQETAVETPAPKKHEHLIMLVAYGDGADGRTEVWREITPEELEEGKLAPEDGMEAIARTGDKAHVFTGLKRKLKGARAGAVFAVTMTDKSVSYVPKSTPVGMWPNVDERISWGAESEARLRQVEGRKALDAEGKKNWHTYAEPLRRIYLRTSYQARDQFLAQLVAYLNSGPPKTGGK